MVPLLIHTIQAARGDDDVLQPGRIFPSRHLPEPPAWPSGLPHYHDRGYSRQHSEIYAKKIPSCIIVWRHTFTTSARNINRDLDV